MKVYAQLAQEQRYQISALMNAGYTQSAIATDMRVDKSTISRELKCNRGQRGYPPRQAQERGILRRHGRSKLRIAPATWNMVDVLSKQDWSPEQISGRLFAEQGIAISHEWICLHHISG